VPPAGTIAGVTPKAAASRGGRLGAVARPGRIRLYGPLAALAVPAVVGSLAFFIWSTASCDAISCVKPSAATWGLVLLIAPTAILAGLPWFVGPVSLLFTGATSLLLWLGFGRWAARRATSEDVDATWRAYWRELAFIVVGLWAGVLLGLAGIGLYLSL
jgi:hypothetical protein